MGDERRCKRRAGDGEERQLSIAQQNSIDVLPTRKGDDRAGVAAVRDKVTFHGTQKTVHFGLLTCIRAAFEERYSMQPKLLS